MDQVIVLGGRQKRALTARVAEWHLYGEAVALSMDLETGALEELVTHITDPSLCPVEKPSIVFKSGAIKDRTLYTCTQTEVVIFDLDSMSQTRHISLPIFNDVHHVTPTSRGTLLVAVTGLDLVVEIDIDGQVVREWTTVETPTWDRFDPKVDYRLVPTTKPHQCHPNFVFEIDDNVWVTRFEQRDAMCLTEEGRRFDIGIERPHDGIVSDGKVYFSTVDGHVVIADTESDSIIDVIDLTTISNPDGATLGWTRSICVLGQGQVLVGFSALRVTQIRENVQWVKRRISGKGNDHSFPTHIACYDLNKRSLVWRRELQDPALDAVFSILPR